MNAIDRRSLRGSTRRAPGRTARIVVLACALAIGLGAPTALADKYESERAGHPLRIIAYVVHPVGVAIDWIVMRPAHWVVSHEPFSTIFGHED